MPGFPSYRGAHGKQGINSCQYPFTTPGLRETIVDKMPCLGAQALSGTRTRDPLITSREHEPIHYSGFFLFFLPGSFYKMKEFWVRVCFPCEMFCPLQIPKTTRRPPHPLREARRTSPWLGSLTPPPSNKHPPPPPPNPARRWSTCPPWGTG